MRAYPYSSTVKQPYIHENTYSFSNFNGATVDIWEWINNFIPHFIMDVITYSRWEQS